MEFRELKLTTGAPRVTSFFKSVLAYSMKFSGVTNMLYEMVGAVMQAADGVHELIKAEEGSVPKKTGAKTKSKGKTKAKTKAKAKAKTKPKAQLDATTLIPISDGVYLQPRTDTETILDEQAGSSAYKQVLAVASEKSQRSNLLWSYLLFNTMAEVLGFTRALGTSFLLPVRLLLNYLPSLETSNIEVPRVLEVLDKVFPQAIPSKSELFLAGEPDAGPEWTSPICEEDVHSRPAPPQGFLFSQEHGLDVPSARRVWKNGEFIGIVARGGLVCSIPGCCGCATWVCPRCESWAVCSDSCLRASVATHGAICSVVEAISWFMSNHVRDGDLNAAYLANATAMVTLIDLHQPAVNAAVSCVDFGGEDTVFSPAVVLKAVKGATTPILMQFYNTAKAWLVAGWEKMPTNTLKGTKDMTWFMSELNKEMFGRLQFKFNFHLHRDLFNAQLAQLAQCANSACLKPVSAPGVQCTNCNCARFCSMCCMSEAKTSHAVECVATVAIAERLKPEAREVVLDILEKTRCMLVMHTKLGGCQVLSKLFPYVSTDEVVSAAIALAAAAKEAVPDEFGKRMDVIGKQFVFVTHLLLSECVDFVNKEVARSMEIDAWRQYGAKPVAVYMLEKLARRISADTGGPSLDSVSMVQEPLRHVVADSVHLKASEDLQVRKMRESPPNTVTFKVDRPVFARDTGRDQKETVVMRFDTPTNRLYDAKYTSEVSQLFPVLICADKVFDTVFDFEWVKTYNMTPPMVENLCRRFQSSLVTLLPGIKFGLKPTGPCVSKEFVAMRRALTILLTWPIKRQRKFVRDNVCLSIVFDMVDDDVMMASLPTTNRSANPFVDGLACAIILEMDAQLIQSLSIGETHSLLDSYAFIDDVFGVNITEAMRCVVQVDAAMLRMPIRMLRHIRHIVVMAESKACGKQAVRTQAGIAMALRKHADFIKHVFERAVGGFLARVPDAESGTTAAPFDFLYKFSDSSISIDHRSVLTNPVAVLSRLLVKLPEFAAAFEDTGKWWLQRTRQQVASELFALGDRNLAPTHTWCNVQQTMGALDLTVL